MRVALADVAESLASLATVNADLPVDHAALAAVDVGCQFVWMGMTPASAAAYRAMLPPDAVVAGVSRLIARTLSRRIDGSNLVNTTNQAISDSVASHRGQGRNLRSSGPHAASTNATFCPETAVRWLRPLARKRSTIARG